jgi:hypothetical protein
MARTTREIGGWARQRCALAASNTSKQQLILKRIHIHL